MDYAELYSYTYENTVLISKRFIVSIFKTSKNKNRAFDFILEKILQGFSKYTNEKFAPSLEKYEKDACEIFADRFSLYSGNRLDVIQCVLEEEAKEAFSGEKYASYNNFIRDLAIIDSLRQVTIHLAGNSNYYRLIYEQDRYDYFYFQDLIDIKYESSLEYNEMMDKKDPNRIKERKTLSKVKDSSKSAKEDSGISIPDHEDWSKIIQDFNDDERALIINVFYEELNKRSSHIEITLTQLTKLMKIAGEFSDLSIFYEKSVSNTFYHKVNKGVDYYKGNGRLKLVESTIEKLQILNLNFISDALISKRTSLRLTKKN